MQHTELRGNRGQSTVEYILMVAFAALLAIQVTKFFSDVFRDGLIGLEANVQGEVRTGSGFGTQEL